MEKITIEIFNALESCVDALEFGVDWPEENRCAIGLILKDAKDVIERAKS